MNVGREVMIAMIMRIVPIQLVHTHVNVGKDLLEMASIVQV